MTGTSHTLRPYQLADRYERQTGTVLLTGVQALTRLPFDQVRADRRAGRQIGVFVSGYEGSPLAGYDQALLREGALRQKHDIIVQPSVNEELAATAVWGSQQRHLGPLDGRDGIVGIWYGKAPGVDRAGDVFKHANLMGVDPAGGVVVLAGDDPGSKSSTLPCFSEGALADANMPVLTPGSPQEALELGLHAVALSRYSGLWTALKIVTDVADGFGTIDVSPEGMVPVVPRLEVDGRPWQHRQGGLAMPPGNLQDEHELFYNRLAAAEAYTVANRLNTVEWAAPDARVGVVAAGKTYYDVRTALDQLQVPRDAVRLLHLRMIWPIDRATIAAFSRGLDEIVVVEEKRSFVEIQVKDALFDLPNRPRVVGKRSVDGRPLVPGDGELTPTRLHEALRNRFAAAGLPTADAPPVPGKPLRRTVPLAAARTPFFCSGCPHNRSTKVPEGSVVGGGIGCHTMTVYLEDRNTVSVSQMGGEGAQWIGRAPFSTTTHLFQNVGDGTFFHSGSQAVRACVAAGVNITYKILYNGTVAMTGGQDAVGALAVPELTRLLEAEGVRRTIVCAEEPDAYPKRAQWAANAEVWPRDRLDEAQRLLRGVPGVTVLVYDQACAAERRRKRTRGVVPTPRRRVVVNERVCEGCGDCVTKSNCLSVEPVETEFGVKRRIHQSSCNQDFTCLEGDCPSFVTYDSDPSGDARRRTAHRVLAAADLPEPNVADTPDPFTMVLAGIGGTGVVTISQVLGTAALMEGRHVSGLDQTGLSQKAGAVVSHVRISEEPWQGASAACGDADLLVAFDLGVAADERVLKRMRSGAHLVASLDLAPTGGMVRDGVPVDNGSAVLVDVRDAVRASSVQTLRAAVLADQLFGNHLLANVAVIGAACQAGVLPLGPAAIEKAFELNGRNVEQSLQAFRWGRLAVADPAAVDAALAQGDETAPADGAAAPLAPHLEALVTSCGAIGQVARLMRIRLAELESYQGTRLAERYARLVREAVEAEQRVFGAADRLAPLVARHLFDLLAYKDEYEVARLHLDDAFRARLAGRSNVRIHLHPPLLRALGLKRKIAFGRSALPALWALRAMRRLRGTPFDAFGYAKVRREERAVIEEYVAALRAETAELGTNTIDRAVAVAEAPSLIRGYEAIKLASIARFRERMRELRGKAVAV